MGFASRVGLSSALQLCHDFFAGSTNGVATGVPVRNPLLAAQGDGGNPFDVGAEDVLLRHVVAHAIVVALVRFGGVWG